MRDGFRGYVVSGNMMKWNGDRFKKRMDTAIVAALRQCALLVEAEAKRICPVDTGRLRASITYEIDENGLIARVGTDVEYAIYVERGTWKMVAQPYLRPALEKLRPQIMAILKAAYRKAV